MLFDWNWLSFVVGVLFTPLCVAVWAVAVYARSHPERRSDIAWAGAFVLALVLVLGLAAYGLVRIVAG